MIALLASGITTLLLAELVFRGLFGAPLREREPLMIVRASPRRGWEMIPSSEHYTYLHHVRVNSLGLRGPEPRARQAGEQRVLCLGDSMTYGQGVGDESTLPALLETLLREQGGAWEAINGGLRAYNTRQELGLLEELLPQLEPDVVVLAWYVNDLLEVDIRELAAHLERTGPVTFDVQARWEGAVVWNWRMRQLARCSALLMKVHDLCVGAGEERPDEDELPRAWTLQEQYFARFLELSRTHGFRFVVAAIPQGARLRGAQGEGADYERLRGLAARLGLEFVDLRPALLEWVRANGRVPVLAYDGHYDESGNACMAAELARELGRAATPK